MAVTWWPALGVGAWIHGLAVACRGTAVRAEVEAVAVRPERRAVTVTEM